MLPQDFRYAARMLLKNGAFTVVAGIACPGIGANSAIFSFAHERLQRPPPVMRPSEVLTVNGTAADIPFGAAGADPNVRGRRVTRQRD